MTSVSSWAAWTMIVSGLITITMVQAAIAPGRALRSMFGEALDGPLADVVVRNWGVLVALVGGMLIYGGWTSSSIDLILVVAGASKIAFITLVLSQGRRYLSKQAGMAIAIDALFVILFAIILFTH